MIRSSPQSDRRRARPPRLAAQPAWLRALAIFCVFLLSVGSVVQACHAHPETLPLSGSSQPNAPGGTPPADHCPLCVAMHSALPSVQGSATAPLRSVRLPVARPADPHRLGRVPFPTFSRPPPDRRYSASVIGRRSEL